MKKFSLLTVFKIVLLSILVFACAQPSFAASPYKGAVVKYGAGDEALFTSSVRIYKIFFTGAAAAAEMDLYNAVTKTGSAVIKFEAPTGDKTETLDFGAEGAVFSTGLYVDATNAGDNYSAVYSNQ